MWSLWQGLCRSYSGRFPILSSRSYHCFCLWRLSSASTSEKRAAVSAAVRKGGEEGQENEKGAQCKSWPQ
jgi:hypothetical protein